MTILVMDDERLALSRIERLLKELGYASTCVNTLEEFKKETHLRAFDLYILDIHMPYISGLDLAKNLLHEHPNAFIIFQTAHENYALKAYEIGAIDYLLKPFAKESLKRSIERAFAYQKERRLSFITKNKEESYLVSQEEIIYVEADLSEVIIRTKEHFSYLDKQISQMEHLLDPKLFFRIHRSFLINIQAIKQMTTIEQSKIEFSFKAIDDVITSSKEGAKKFRETFKEISC
jgi:two-component system LytT family response regulator